MLLRLDQRLNLSSEPQYIQTSLPYVGFKSYVASIWQTEWIIVLTTRPALDSAEMGLYPFQCLNSIEFSEVMGFPLLTISKFIHSDVTFDQNRCLRVGAQILFHKQCNGFPLPLTNSEGTFENFNSQKTIIENQ